MNGKFGEARYDERQTAVRGRAFKWGYVTLLAGLIVYCITDGIWSWCVPLTGCAAAMSFSLIVVCCICIDGDAYWWMDAGRAGQSKPYTVASHTARISVLGGSTAGRLHTERATTTNNRLNLLILRKPLPYRVWVFTISRASSGISVVMKSIPISAISWISSGSFTVHTFVVSPKALHFSTHSGCSRNTL